jgi:hypothetical protein
VSVEKTMPTLRGTQHPQFLGGERRCPPEDCGGVPGYCEFLDNIGSKRKRKAALDWYGGRLLSNQGIRLDNFGAKPLKTKMNGSRVVADAVAIEPVSASQFW